MYQNLKQGLEAKGYSNDDLASLLGINVKTVRSKINGLTDFTLPEANKIMTFIFPEFSMAYIFKEDKSQKGGA